MSGNVRIRRRSRLSNLEKRMLVRGRLIDPDSERCSDREIARELGLSQPFVSAQRRFVRSVRTASLEVEDARDVPFRLPDPSPLVEDRSSPEARQERVEVRAPLFTPVGLGRVGWVKRRSSFDDARIGDWDPFDLGQP